MKFKKPLLLFLALILPVFIFLFLKKFGRNEFIVEPLFQDSVQVNKPCAGFQYSTPYFVPDSLFENIGWSGASYLMVVVSDSSHELKDRQTVQLQRVLKEFAADSLQVINITTQYPLFAPEYSGKLHSEKYSQQDLDKIQSCVLLLQAPFNAVVIDSQKRIMGQYSISDMDETDRLILELKIMLQKY